MAFKLNWVACVWRTASMGYQKRGRKLGYVLVGNGGGGGGGGIKQLISYSFSSYRQSSSWSLLLRGIRINSSPYACACNHPLLSSTAPCLLIPSPDPKDKDVREELIAAAIAKEVGTGTGTGEDEFRFPDYCLYSLADRKMMGLNNVRSKSNIVIPDHAECIGSSHGWLAYVDYNRDDYAQGDDYALFLTNPLITPVPPTIQIPCLSSCIPKKLVMSYPPTPSSASSVSANDINDCALMAIDFQNSLVYYKFGDLCWRKLDDYDRELYDYAEIVYSPKDELFYCIDNFGQIEAWDLRRPVQHYQSIPHTPKLRRRISLKSNTHFWPKWKTWMPFTYYSIQKPPAFPESAEENLRNREFPGKHYLAVDSFSGDILIVRKYAAPFRFQVYRLNVPNKSWDYVECLGDGVLFVGGQSQSFMLSAQDFPPGVLIPNSIYFTDKDDTGIYNLRDFTVEPIFPPHHPFHNIMWFNPNPNPSCSRSRSRSHSEPP